VVAFLGRHLVGDHPIDGIGECCRQPQVLGLGDIFLLCEPMKDDRLITEFLEPGERLVNRRGVGRLAGRRLDALAPPGRVPLLGFREAAQDRAPARIGLTLAQQPVRGRRLDFLAPELPERAEVLVAVHSTRAGTKPWRFPPAGAAPA
jgi:hypothetical protein